MLLRAFGFEFTGTEILTLIRKHAKRRTLDDSGAGTAESEIEVVLYREYLEILKDLYSAQMANKEKREELIEDCFSLFDVHHIKSDRISFEDFKYRLRQDEQHLAEEGKAVAPKSMLEIENLFDEFDLNQDGYIDRVEFKHVFKLAREFDKQLKESHDKCQEHKQALE